MRSVVAGAVLALPFLLGAAAASEPEPEPEVALVFSDPDIVESSGLVVTAEVVATVNDSGDSARIFVVDPKTGDTLGQVSYDAEARDNEALAPADEGRVWVGDIGDNFEARDHVEVTRVPLAQADSEVEGETFTLAYPDGPHDAETLLAHPDTGRLFVVTKEVLGGSVYAAPRRLDPSSTNELEKIASDIPGLVTDGAFLSGGDHIILRNYTRAFVLSTAPVREIGSFDLPPQEQGEGIAVSPGGEVFLSSEGVESEMLRITLPLDIRKEIDPTATHEEDAGTGQSESGPSESGQSESGQSGTDQPGGSGTVQPDPWPWAIGGLVAVAAIAVLIRSLRPH